jgi:methionyl-tRNA formyltransferase
MVRAFTPWPSAFTALGGRTVKILATRVARDARPAGPPGTIAVDGGVLQVTTGDGVLEVVTVQAEGKKAMPAAAFAAGARLGAAARFE